MRRDHGHLVKLQSEKSRRHFLFVSIKLFGLDKYSWISVPVEGSVLYIEFE